MGVFSITPLKNKNPPLGEGLSAIWGREYVAPPSSSCRFLSPRASASASAIAARPPWREAGAREQAACAFCSRNRRAAAVRQPVTAPWFAGRASAAYFASTPRV
ncbi:putative non-ribosomal peptide synthase domain protein [Burkholderia pseudomallei TSV32]|nr:putative non-ribosomal peptide synthase domain protein [Burkholderia pseudomallei TSV32]